MDTEGHLIGFNVKSSALPLKVPEKGHNARNMGTHLSPIHCLHFNALQFFVTFYCLHPKINNFHMILVKDVLF